MYLIASIQLYFDNIFSYDLSMSPYSEQLSLRYRTLRSLFGNM